MHRHGSFADASMLRCGEGLSGGMMVDNLGHKHCGAAHTVADFEIALVRYGRTVNSLNAGACGLTLFVCLASVLLWLSMHHDW